MNYLAVVKCNRVMEKLLLQFGILIMLTGCSGRTILRNGENYFKAHIGDYESYKRIEWKLTDTTFLNDLERNKVLDSLQKAKNTLSELKKAFDDCRDKLRKAKFEISQCVNGIYFEKQIWYGISPYNRSNGNQKVEIVKHNKSELEDDLRLAISDSAEIAQSFTEMQTKLITLERLSNVLRETREKSPIETISMYIRFRAKMESQYLLTYKGVIDYDYENKSYSVLEIKFDGVEKKVNR